MMGTEAPGEERTPTQQPLIPPESLPFMRNDGRGKCLPIGLGKAT